MIPKGARGTPKVTFVDPTKFTQKRFWGAKASKRSKSITVYYGYITERVGFQLGKYGPGVSHHRRRVNAPPSHRTASHGIGVHRVASHRMHRLPTRRPPAGRPAGRPPPLGMYKTGGPT